MILEKLTMRKMLSIAVAAACALPLSPVHADPELDALRQQLKELKQDYETRLQALESKLVEAERVAPPVEAATAPTTAQTRSGVSAPGLTPLQLNQRGQVSSGNAFNPALSVIMDGVYYHDNHDGEGASLIESLDGIAHAHNHGDEEEEHAHAHSHGGVEQGFNLRDVEMALSATVDPYFDARAQLVFSESEGVEVEEAYFRSRRLPAGLQLKGGKFLSDIGYANNQHPHQWDFADQNLPYQVLFGGHGLADNGLQLTWLPAWDIYARFGAELFQGRNEKMGALVDEHHYLFADEEIELPLDEKQGGPRLWTLFAKFAPDLGYNHALQGGLFYVRSNQYQELHGDDADVDGDQTHALQGKTWLLGTDWVYKYDAAGAHGAGDFSLQAEYLYQVKDLDLIYHGSLSDKVGALRKFTEDGLYVQAVYGIAPRWQAGLRYDIVGLTNRLEDDGGTLREWDHSQRWGLMLSFRPTEYSVLRAQFTRGDFSLDGERETVNQFWLQYQLSLGVHGAHSF